MKDNVGDRAQATPSTAVQMSGLNAVPIAGDDFTVAASLDEVTPCPSCMHSSVFQLTVAVMPYLVAASLAEVYSVLRVLCVSLLSGCNPLVCISSSMLCS